MSSIHDAARSVHREVRCGEMTPAIRKAAANRGAGRILSTARGPQVPMAEGAVAARSMTKSARAVSAVIALKAPMAERMSQKGR